MGCVSSQSEDLERDRPKSDVDSAGDEEDNGSPVRGGQKATGADHVDSVVPGDGNKRSEGHGARSSGNHGADPGATQPLVAPGAAGTEGAESSMSPNRLVLDQSLAGGGGGDGGSNEAIWQWLREIIPPKETTVNR